MTAIASPKNSPEPAVGQTVADLIERLGGIAPGRIRIQPSPGTATERDAIELEAKEKRLFELVDGTLVEKAMGYRESVFAGAILALLRAFVMPRHLGLVSGADGIIKLFSGLIRIPDVAFVSWARVPGGRMPSEAVPGMAPNLVVEVLSESNTPAEMRRKREEYFSTGVEAVWIFDLTVRTVAVYGEGDEPAVLGESETLDGGQVLPGFTLVLRELFAELDLQSDNSGKP